MLSNSRTKAVGRRSARRHANEMTSNAIWWLKLDSTTPFVSRSSGGNGDFNNSRTADEQRVAVA